VRVTVGRTVGLEEGIPEGRVVGLRVGLTEGVIEGSEEGLEGSQEGNADGFLVGFLLGLREGGREGLGEMEGLDKHTNSQSPRAEQVAPGLQQGREGPQPKSSLTRTQLRRAVGLGEVWEVGEGDAYCALSWQELNPRSVTQERPAQQESERGEHCWY